MKFWTKSLMFRLVTTFSLLSLLTVSTVGAIAFIGARTVIEKLVFDRLKVTATLKEDALNLWVNSQREATVSLSQLPQIRTQAAVLLTRNETDPKFRTAYVLLRQYLTSAITSRPELEEVFILTDIGGKVVLSTDKSHEGEYRVKDKYFTEGRRGTFVQNVYASSFTGKPTMTISTPLFDSNNKRLGVLAAHLRLERMDRIILESTNFDKSGETYLIGQFNLFVSGERFGRKEYPRGVHSEGINAALRTQNGHGLYLNYAGIPVIGVYRWMQERELALLVEMHQSEAFSPARQLAWAIFLIGLVSAGGLTVGVYLLARQTAHPILAITDAAIRVASGDLSQMAPVLTQDEVGLLARAFNQMTKELRLLYMAQEEKVRELQAEQEKSELLLLNILPKPIADRLKQQHSTIAEHFENVTVLFADIVGFTKLSSRVTPTELVHSLNRIFSAFDALAEKHNLEKIKTIGDAYMVVGGLPMAQPDHAEAIAEMALDMQAIINRLNLENREAFSIRIGINTGPVIAGVIGLKKFSYDLWGDTVNTASRMESHGIPGCIQVTETTYELLQHKYWLEMRGTIEVKGKGDMITYLLKGRKDSEERGSAEGKL